MYVVRILYTMNYPNVGVIIQTFFAWIIRIEWACLGNPHGYWVSEGY